MRCRLIERLAVVAAVALLTVACVGPEAPTPAPLATAAAPVIATSAVTAPEPSPGRAVDWHFAAEISAPDRAALIAAGEADVAHIEQRFAHRFSTPPQVFVLDTEQSFAQSLSEMFGLDAQTASL